jgi:hypothetical protein
MSFVKNLLINSHSQIFAIACDEWTCVDIVNQPSICMCDHQLYKKHCIIVNSITKKELICGISCIEKIVHNTSELKKSIKITKSIQKIKDDYNSKDISFDLCKKCTFPYPENQYTLFCSRNKCILIRREEAKQIYNDPCKMCLLPKCKKTDGFCNNCTCLKIQFNEECDECNEKQTEKEVYQGLFICHTCMNKHKFECEQCEEICINYNEFKKSVCGSCFHLHHNKCKLCDNKFYVNKKEQWKSKTHCYKCYKA